jgi:RNA polymerase sigma-70 factor, ECF subfamily
MGRVDDTDAIDQLVERHGMDLYRLAMRVTGVSDEAEAVVADALAAAARRVATLGGEDVASWIYRVAAEAAYHRLRARRPNVKEIALEDLLPPLDADRHFAPMVDWSKRGDGSAQGELHRVLSDAIETLSAEDWTALVLHDVHGMSKADIADALATSPTRVMTRVHRARLFVRQRLSTYLDAA